MEQILASIASTVAVAMLTWVCSKIKKLVTQGDALRDGLRSVLRNELVRLHRDLVVAQGWCTLEDKEYAERTYEAYHELGGNGTGTILYEEIMKLPIKGK